MRYSIMVILRDGTRRRAHLTDESSASSYGQAVVELAGISYGPGDMSMMGMRCLSRSDEAQETLKTLGYPLAQGQQLYTCSLAPDVVEAIKDYAAREGISQGEVVERAVRGLEK